VSTGKTNAVRILERLGIPYDLAAYDPGDAHAEAAEVARRLGVPADALFKTLVARDDAGGVRVYCVPAAADLDLKKAARASLVRSIALVPLKDLQPLTGYLRGGCSPLGMKRPYPVLIDEFAAVHIRILVNAGARGLQVILAPADLARACGGGFADISAAPDPDRGPVVYFRLHAAP
jgi:Cys-tRNA(Pro)/Cys-tRNA(Cys) deacylase